MKFYDYSQIKAAADCAAVARDFLGMQVSPEGRCAATWRGGNSSMYDNCDAPLQVAAAAKTNYSIFKGEL